MKIGDALYFFDPELRKRKDLTYTRTFKDVHITATFTDDDRVPTAEIYITSRNNDKQLLRFNPLTSAISSWAGDIDLQELGCDTASYVINDVEIRTGADGYYGFVATAKLADATLIVLDGGYDFTTLEAFMNAVLDGLEIDATGHKVGGRTE